MQRLAENLLAAFDFDFEADPPAVVLSSEAPFEFYDLLMRLEIDPESGDLTAVYEALSMISEADSPRDSEIDEKICPLDLFRRLLDVLDNMADPRDTCA